MQIGPYRVLRVLARGGMGEVCLASLERAGGFRKLVALKRALPEFAADPDFGAMFQREARLAAALNHRNIVQVFDFAHHANEAWLAMEYVRGVDLKAVLDAERLPVGLAITIGLACARGLDYVHRAVDAQGQPLHLVHQDVSPANVLLSYEGDIKLSDFGVAWQGDAAQRGLEGKLGYMSPEAVRGQRLDARADQFALGVVLYEMLSGARAFWAQDGSEAIITRVRSAQPLRPLADAAPALPPALRAVVERAMAANPEDRFDDVGQFAHALDQAAAEVDRGPRLGPWLVARFPEVEAVDDAPVEVTAAASAPIAVAPKMPVPLASLSVATTLPARPGAPNEGTAAARHAILPEPSLPAPTLDDSPPRAALVWAVIAVLVGVAALVFWPTAEVASPSIDAQVDAHIADAARAVDAALAVDARIDARQPDAKLPDASPISDAMPPIDARPPSAPPRRPRTKAPRSKAPRSTAPRTVAAIAIAPVSTPITAAPITAAPTVAPASVATLAPLSGPRIRASGARITAGQVLRDGWYRIFAGGVFVRFRGEGPAISLRLKPQAGRLLATITSKPFAPLRVDNRPLGSTPAAVVPLTAGRHIIEVGVAPAVTRLIIETGG